MKEKIKKNSDSKNLIVKTKEFLVKYKPSMGKITAAFLKDKIGENTVNQITQEWKELKFKKNFKKQFDTSQPPFSFYELLKFIDEETPDEILLEALKLIFFNSIAKNASKQDEILGYHLLQVCKKLKSGDILILKACYEIPKTMESFNQITSKKSWLKVVANYLKLPKELIESYEENLINNKLLSGRQFPDSSGVQSGSNGRLTDLGIQFCEFITKYPS